MSQPRSAYTSTTPRDSSPTPSSSAPDTALHIEYAGDSASSSHGAAESTASPHQGYLLFHAAADDLRRGTSSPLLATESPDALQHTIVALRAELNAQRTAHEALKAANEQQAAEIESLRLETSALRHDIVDADIENDGLAAEIKALRRQREYLLDDAEAESIKRDFDAGLKDREIDRLQVLLRHASNVHDERMRERITSHAALSRDLRAELGATRADRASIEKRCAALEGTVETKEARIQELVTMYAATSDVNGHYYRWLNLARLDNFGLQAQLERARGEIGRLEGVVGAAREYFDSLHRIREEMRELAERIWGRKEEEEGWEDVEEEEEEEEEDTLDGDFVEV